MSGEDGRRQGLSTPQTIRVLTGIVLLFAAVLGIVAAVVSGALRDGFTEVSDRAAPQVAASADLYFRLSDMDAAAADVLLVGSDHGLSDNRQRALTNFKRRQKDADADIRQVATIGGTDPTVAALVQTVLDDFGRFQGMAQTALNLNASLGDPAGRPSAAELDNYQQATALLADALDNTQKLINTNQDALNRAYDSSRGSALLARILIITLGVILLGALVVAQVYLRRRHNRRINLALLLTTGTAAALMVVGTVVVSIADDDIVTAKQGAFDSIVALDRARAVSQEATAEESRFLVDPAHAQQHQDAFQTASQSVLALSGADLTHYDAALDTALTRYAADNADIAFGGYLGDELRGVTSEPERLAALRVIARYQGYERADRLLRATLAGGAQRDAIDFDTGAFLGYPNFDLDRYDQAVVGLIAMKQAQFDVAVRDGQDQLAGWTLWIPVGGAVLMIVLVGFGVLPRLREYRG